MVTFSAPEASEIEKNKQLTQPLVQTTSVPGITKTIGAAGVSPVYSNEVASPLAAVAQPAAPATQPVAAAPTVAAPPAQAAAAPIATAAATGITAAQAIQRPAVPPVQIPGVGSDEGLQRTARANQIRGEMIDSMIKADGGNGVAVLKDRNAEWNDQMRRQGEIQQITDAMARNPHLANAMSGALAQTVSGHNQQAAEAFKQKAVMAGLDIQRRGQESRDMNDRERNKLAQRGLDISANTDAQRLGLESQRVGIQQDAASQSADKWAIDRTILQGQVADNEAIRAARTNLAAAIESGDPAKIEAARAKAVASGVKFDKPNNEFVAVTDSMGMNITRTNKDTGAVDIIDGKTGQVKASIAAPGAAKKTTQQQAPAAALDYLKKNPSQAEAFKAKYGYLPEGF